MNILRPMQVVSVLAVLALAFSACSGKNDAETGNDPAKPAATLRMNLPGVPTDSPMPSRFTCEGGDHNPPIYIAGIPAQARSLAVTMEDPDAPGGTYHHWVMWNIPSHNRIINMDEIPRGAVLGKNDEGKTAYKGPCPPTGEHRYQFRLYALDAMLDLKAGAGYDDLMKAMEGHIVEQTEFVGRYEKGKGKVELPYIPSSPPIKGQ